MGQKTLLLLIFALAFGVSAFAFSGKRPNLDPTDPTLAEREGVEMVSQQLLVKFHSENAAMERQKIFKKFNGREVERVGTTPLFLVQFAEGTDILEIKTKLEHLEGISYAEPNLVMRALPAGKKK